MPRDADDAANSPGLFARMPNNLQKMVKAVGFATFTNMDEDEQEVYDRVKNGRCMTCEGPLEGNSNFIITKHGIVGGYCSGQCHSDMAVMGFLQEQHDEITTAVSFRGEGHAQADLTPDTPVPDTLGEDPAFEDDQGEG